MKRLFALCCLLFTSAAFSIWTLWLALRALLRIRLTDTSAVEATHEFIMLVSLLVTFLLLCVVINETVYMLRQKKNRSGFVATRIAWLVGLLASNVNASATSIATQTSVVTPVATNMSPIAAVALLTHIERRRREQIRTRKIPDSLTEQEMERLHEVRRAATRATHPCIVKTTEANEHSHPELMAAVERQSTESFLRREDPQWLVEVKVFGYPMVVSADGAVAEFRKKRALELLTWLSLNRDRARRSAARTAMWDIDISDSAFATVVSDMRRGLRELNTSQDGASWLPATYSDDLPLSDLVITDVERLGFAFCQFKETHGEKSAELRDVLRGIRDVPFAGTSYAWADLDGTTTRLVITAVDICTAVAEMAAENSDSELLTLAVNAGLRVLPGCEELLTLQSQHLSHTFATRKMK